MNKNPEKETKAFVETRCIKLSLHQTLLAGIISCSWLSCLLMHLLQRVLGNHSRLALAQNCYLSKCRWIHWWPKPGPQKKKSVCLLWSSDVVTTSMKPSGISTRKSNLANGSKSSVVVSHLKLTKLVKSCWIRRCSSFNCSLLLTAERVAASVIAYEPIWIYRYW